jgi:hypothetical protein
MDRAAVLRVLVGTKKSIEDITDTFESGFEMDEEDEEDLAALAEDLLLGARTTISLGREADAENHRKTYRYVPRTCLHDPAESAWTKIFMASTSDASFSSLVRFSRNSFQRLLACSDLEQLAWWDGFTDSSRTERAHGRPHKLNGPGHMALALTWLASKIDNRHLGTMFGLTNPARDLRISLSFLLDTLKGIDESSCKVRPNQLQASAAAVEGQYGPCPLPGFHCCGAGDCFVSYTFNQGNAVEQNSFYNGKNGKPAVNNLTLIDFLGSTFFFSGNWRGKRHDSMLFQASGCEDFLRRVLPPGYFIVMDDAFGRDGLYDIVWANGRFNPGAPYHPDVLKAFYHWCMKIRKSVEWRELRPPNPRALNACIAAQLSRCAPTSPHTAPPHNSTENHTYYALWPRLLMLLPADDSQFRGLLLELAVRLTNVITRWEDNHNQTKTVFREAFLRSPLAGFFM